MRSPWEQWMPRKRPEIQLRLSLTLSVTTCLGCSSDVNKCEGHMRHMRYRMPRNTAKKAELVNKLSDGSFCGKSDFLGVCTFAAAFARAPSPFFALSYCRVFCRCCFCALLHCCCCCTAWSSFSSLTLLLPPLRLSPNARKLPGIASASPPTARSNRRIEQAEAILVLVFLTGGRSKRWLYHRTQNTSFASPNNAQVIFSHCIHD